jgi:hypothetical protein
MASDSPRFSKPAWRHAALAGAVALVMGVAAVGWRLSRPAEAPPPTVAAVPAPAALRAGPTADASTLPPSTAAAAAPSRPSAGPALAPQTTPPSEDVRKVQQALEGGTAQEALEAAQFLSMCPLRQQMVEAMLMSRDHPESQPWPGTTRQSLDADIAREQDLQRRCQYIDSSLLARAGELYGKAYKGGATAAAMPYLMWLRTEGQHEADAELVRKLQRETRQWAEDADPALLATYAHVDPALLGLSPMQHHAYKEAWLRITAELSGEAAAQAHRALIDGIDKGIGVPPLSPEQQREADALSNQVLDAWRKRSGKGG